MRPPRLRSPFLRAVVPVLGGAVLLGLIFVVTWFVAVFIANGGADSTARLAPTTFSAGSAERRAESVTEDGPLIFAGLNTTSGERTLVVDHQGEDPLSGWKLYWAYPADRGAACAVVQEPGTREFTDCDGRPVAVTDLARPEGVFVRIDDKSLVIDLRGAVEGD